MYDGVADPQVHVPQYKHRMFTIQILKKLREPCMCKGFGAKVTRLAL